ncbi:MAG: DUF4398 domain-containing protein [Alphaproteobacteria bacterium]|nr:DUF4398 domain-containing protein [Alphaproteobacteria bacterium]
MRASSLALLALLPLATGCAAKTTSGLMQAESVVLAAEDAGADQRAVYEMTLARAYLAKAQEEWADSQYEDADLLAAQAVEHAERAEQVAKGAKVGEDVDDLVPEEVRRPVELPRPPSEEDEAAQQVLEQVIEGGDAMVRPPEETGPVELPRPADGTGGSSDPADGGGAGDDESEESPW